MRRNTEARAIVTSRQPVDGTIVLFLASRISPVLLALQKRLLTCYNILPPSFAIDGIYCKLYYFGPGHSVADGVINNAVINNHL